MSSLKYEITQSPVKIKNKKSTIMTQTVKEYRNDAIHFGEWCKKNRGIRHLDELCAQKVTLLQDYADDLAAQGKSAATIHKYMSGACRVFGVELGIEIRSDGAISNQRASYYQFLKERLC